jgi:hypothetical protein
MPPPDLSYYSPSQHEPPRRQSTSGMASFGLGVLGVAAPFAIFVMTYFRVGGQNAAAASVGFSVCCGSVFAILGLTLGIFGLTQFHVVKTWAKLGIILNAATIVLHLVFWMLVSMMAK